MSAENILLQILRSNDPLLNISEQAWIEIIDLANRQHIMPYLYYHLKEIGALELIPIENKEILYQFFKQSTMRNMALVAEFRRIADTFNKKGIPVIGLKGLQLVQDNIYPHIGLRFMRDIDLFVPISQIGDAYDCVSILGYQCDKEITKLDFSMKYHHHLYQQINYEKNIVLELHGYLENVMRIDPSLWWQNVQSKNSHNMFLDTEDLLLHLCLHISYSDIFKTDLRHYLDIYMILKNRVIDWEQFLDRAQSRGLTRGVLLVLDITSRLFGYKLPAKLDNAIVRDTWHEESIKHAIEFMWQYRKSSKGYEQYGSKMFLSDEPLLMRFFKRIFIPKEELCCQYSLKPDSGVVYLYYFRRVYDLFQRHFTDTIKSKTDNSYIDSIAKTKILHVYLFDK